MDHVSKSVKSRQLFTESFTNILRGLTQYQTAHKIMLGTPLAEDYVLGEAWLDAVKAVRAMLCGELGTHDGSQLDSAIVTMIIDAGFPHP